MKRKLSEIFYSLLGLVIKTRLAFFKIKNSSKPNLFVFTDSRGFNVNKITHKYNAFSWYTKYFVKKYCADAYVCPERTTTVYDFLEQYHNSKKEYKWVIAHIGVVDFAPRPLSQNIEILKSKRDKIVKFFGNEIYEKLVNFKGYETLYNGEKTASTVPEFMVEKVAEEFNKIENLIYVSCNAVDLNWVGNYKERPKNSTIIIEKTNRLLASLKTKNLVDMSKLTTDQIHEYTCDNVHLTEKGSSFILQQLKNIIEK